MATGFSLIFCDSYCTYMVYTWYCGASDNDNIHALLCASLTTSDKCNVFIVKVNTKI